ncbi:Glycine-rich RNA-binding protein RZ1C-like protein, partial [Drosera capensis]
MEDAIREMHGREFFDRVISVNKAELKPGDDSRDDYSVGYPSGPRGGYRDSERKDQSDECFKCGCLGHWARDCPSAGGVQGLDALYSSRSRYEDSGSRGGRGGRGGRFRDRDRFLEDRYSGGRYGERDRFDNIYKYGSRDRFVSDRYPPGGDSYGSDRYRDSDRYPLNGYEKERGYEQDGGRRRGSDRYAGGGPIREVGRGYSDRPAPYDPPRGQRAPDVIEEFAGSVAKSRSFRSSDSWPTKINSGASGEKNNGGGGWGCGSSGGKDDQEGGWRKAKGWQNDGGSSGNASDAGGNGDQGGGWGKSSGKNWGSPSGGGRGGGGAAGLDE